MKVLTVFAFTLLLLVDFAPIAYADSLCEYEGNSYSEGTVLGPFICTEHGWERRQSDLTNYSSHAERKGR